MNTQNQPSKRRLALELCQKLLDDLGNEKISTSTALLRLLRVAQLANDEKLSEKIKHELDGYPYIGASPDDLKQQLKKFAAKRPDMKDVDIDEVVKEQWDIFPRYRVLSLSKGMGSSFKTVYMTSALSKYEELLERIRKNPKANYTYSSEGQTVYPSAAELNRLVSGVRHWVYEEASKIEERLEFGQIPIAALETTFEFVDSHLFEIVPTAAERLLVAYRNLAEKSEENWVNVVDTCRRIIKDFADAIFPAQNELVEGMVVTDDKYLNRIRAFIKQKVSSRRQREQLLSVLELIGEILSRTDNLASRSVHAGKVTRYEAERILIYTYLAIGDVLILSGMAQRDDANPERVNLNEATLEDLQNKLGLTAKVAAAVIQGRKYKRYESWDEVAAINGIGLATLTKLRDVASL